MDHPIESFIVLHYSCWFLSKSKKVDSILAKNEKVVGLEQKAFDWRFP